MKKKISTMMILAAFLTTSSSLSANGVVIIPMGTSSAKGANKQVQYNDNGKTAGSKIYYDKGTSRVGIGTSLPSYLFHVKASKANFLASVHNTGTGSSAKGMIIRADGGDPFVVQTTGGNNAFAVGTFGNTFIYGAALMQGKLAVGGGFPSYTLTVAGSAGKPGGGSWSDTSDMRLKKNISNLTNALDRITLLQGHSFEWINPKEHGGRKTLQAGFVAQEVEEIFPEWIIEVGPEGKDANLIPEAGKVKALQLPHGFNAYLVEAIKELRAENEALKELLCMNHPGETLCR